MMRGVGEGGGEQPAVLSSPRWPRRLSPQRALPWGRLADHAGPRMWRDRGRGPVQLASLSHLNPVPLPSPRGVGFSFLLAAPLILLVFATFLVGGNVQTLVCRSWESRELYKVSLPCSAAQREVEGDEGRARG